MNFITIIMVKIAVLGLNDCYSNEDWYINNFSFKNVKDNIYFIIFNYILTLYINIIGGDIKIIRR